MINKYDTLKLNANLLTPSLLGEDEVTALTPKVEKTTRFLIRPNISNQSELEGCLCTRLQGAGRARKASSASPSANRSFIGILGRVRL